MWRVNDLLTTSCYRVNVNKQTEIDMFKVTFMMTQLRTDEILYRTDEVASLVVVNYETEDGRWFQSTDDCMFSFVIGGLDEVKAGLEESRITHGLSEEEASYSLTEYREAFDGFGEFEVLMGRSEWKA
jgi:hypothetical protein